MKRLARELFRHVGPVRLVRPDGSHTLGRGLIAPLNEEKDEFREALRHRMGAMKNPLYVFTGYLCNSEDVVGGVLSQDTDNYEVLSVKPVRLGRQILYDRMVLERREAHDGE